MSQERLKFKDMNSNQRFTFVALQAFFYGVLIFGVTSCVSAVTTAQNAPVVLSDFDARYVCKQRVQDKLRDPKSVQWVHEASERVNDTQREVFVTYRAKNAFGGYVDGYAACVVKEPKRGEYLVKLVAQQ